MKKKYDFQKIFWSISFGFIITCIFWYGGRFIYLYLENDKKLEVTKNVLTLSNSIKDQYFNTESLKQVKEDYYLHGNDINNYVSYSNLLWRVVKINKDDSIVLVTENVVGTLAYSDSTVSYNESNINKWLNEEKFIKMLKSRDYYLVNNSICIDEVSNVSDTSCNIKDDSSYIGLLSLNDYLNTGGNNGFINNNKYTYLTNKTSENKVWYITDEGKLDNSDGSEIIGLRPTITLKPNLEIEGGNGTIESPYVFTGENEFIGSYVKLDNDIWRIYEEDEELVKLVLDDTLKFNEENVVYSYSTTTYNYNDKEKNSLAYYLNKDYYNTLSYKDLIVENTYKNGLYDIENKFNHNEIANNTINTKVSIPSIDDIIFNDNTLDYFTSTSKSSNKEAIYVQNKSGIISPRLVNSKSNIRPCISIKKETLISGTGSKTDPYGVVN